MSVMSGLDIERQNREFDDNILNGNGLDEPEVIQDNLPTDSAEDIQDNMPTDSAEDVWDNMPTDSIEDIQENLPE